MPADVSELLVPLRDLARRTADALASGDGHAQLAVRSELARLAPLTSVMHRAALVTYLRANIAFTTFDALDHRAGIYLITADHRLTDESAGSESYVGCARDIRTRFHLPTFGHLSDANKTRSQLVLAQPGHQVAVFSSAAPAVEDDQLDRWLAEEEVFWWAVMVAAGLIVVNSTSSLGRTGGDADQPLVACELATGRVRVFRSQAEATRVLELPVGYVNVVVNGWQSQNRGYTFRYATDDETELVGTGWLGHSALNGAPVVEELSAKRRRWVSGPLPAADREFLAGIKRPRYSKAAKTGRWGVVATANKPGRFTAYYVSDPARRYAPTTLGRDFDTVDAAVAAREAFLDANPAVAAFNRRNAA